MARTLKGDAFISVEELGARMAKDLNERLAPVIENMKANGISDAEIRLEIERALFDEFRGLHGFPDSQRP